MDIFHHKPVRGIPTLLANGWAPFIGLPLHLVQLQYAARGFPTAVIPYRRDDMHNMDAFADHVALSVYRFCKSHGLEKVNLIGVSLGGLAGYIAVKRHGIAPLLATFATVGSPLRGTTLAYAGIPSGVFSRIGLQVRPNGGYVRRIDALPLPEGPRYVSVAGVRDRTCPPSLAHMPGAEQHTLDFGHAGVLYHPSIPDVVAPTLGTYA